MVGAHKIIALLLSSRDRTGSIGETFQKISFYAKSPKTELFFSVTNSDYCQSIFLFFVNLIQHFGGGRWRGEERGGAAT